ncbi:hypothetical protein CLAFUW4_08570 [Fulvia fulva]|uniref:Uncharacterized protein n=1 Tax=Passalora fulva TaxID=5499 RepID=A0A9Q8LCP6_PASFU|nr:uncharacterized protein CLAFUR5_08672 [Fulvia fulva]KAK4629231.1 hypothetical protein CLAFUR4_08573 [Fulvia fulva]KAK4630648.1 hypothetical protein CLAFUR0_08568 [Fulvia fulva]UJO14982.1 hypothetical protein CLAFUR5_08672 [Fulvia fulva]WPV12962.1 hypothetical protein CLAFUW4_08570 [Fulvia fulva]WPV27415.1 hypothetical protein CLAFUW7_08568 [Fulvia fulva]
MAGTRGKAEPRPGPWVLVYVKADSSVSLERREVVKNQSSRPVSWGKLNAKPWSRRQSIEIPVASETPRQSFSDSGIDSTRSSGATSPPYDTYQSTLVFNRIDSSWKRLAGLARTYEVFEDPLY